MAETTTPVTPVTPVQPSPVQEKKKGGALKIVIIVLVVLLLLCIVCGAGSFFFIQRTATDVQTKVQNEIDKGGNTVKDQFTNSIKDSVTDAVESAGSSAASKLNGTGKLPEGFPSSVLLASDYEVITGSTKEVSGKTSYTVSYYSAKTIDQLVDIYKTDMPNKGWTLDNASNIWVAETLTLSNSEASLGVVINGSISKKEPRNMVTLVYQEK